MWHLKDPAHDPAEFLTIPGVCFYPVQREPLRSTWVDMTFNPRIRRANRNMRKAGHCSRTGRLIICHERKDGTVLWCA